MADSPASDSRATERDGWLAETWAVNKRLLGDAVKAGLWIALPFFLLWLIAWPRPSGIKQAPESAMVQEVHALGLAMFSYANDHNGAYPDGGSSTEVFQKLVDGGYVMDPAYFFIRMPGKTRPVAGQKLKPENVCLDVTGGADLKDSDELPILITTGYRLAYVPGGAAVPILPRGPEFESPGAWPFSWLTWPHGPMNGLAVYFKGNRAMWVTAQGTTVMQGQRYSLPHVIPVDFDAKGKTYRQLTPEGVLR